jgi:hypothetical protein
LAWSTLEVRWFFPGPLAETGPGVEEWFRTRPLLGDGGRPLPLEWDPAAPAWRQDRYLLIPDHDDMGIKWREGRLDIKGREVVLGQLVFGRGVEGRSERWIKWSYAGSPIERRFLGLFQGDAAAGVAVIAKRRLQRCLWIDRTSGPVEVSCDQPRPRGINIELVQIRMPGSRTASYWSLAFEAFPGDRQMIEPFEQTVGRFLEGCSVLPLSAKHSMAYPRWLLSFDRSCRAAGRDGTS